MTTQSHLLPLADVHLPPAPSIWPLAWGWWVSLVILIAICVFGLWWFKRNNINKEVKLEALSHLKDLKTQPNFVGLNTLLKQVALTYFPREQVAGLTGHSWLAFLDEQLKPQQRGFCQLEQAWQQGLFSSANMDMDTYQQCYTLAELWVKHVSSHSTHYKG